MRPNNPTRKPRAILREPTSATWLEFTAPCRIVTTRRIDEVLACVRQVTTAVEKENLYAVGFITYEAAPAFDDSLPSKHTGAFPLLWFCLFRQVYALTTLPQGKKTDLPASWQPSVPPDEYRRCFDTIKRYIQSGDTYQVNFTYRLRASTEVDPWDFFVQIVGEDTPPYAAFLDTGAWTICSASPELFLRLDGDQIESRPMKGTAARGLWFEDDCSRAATLYSSEKERAENVMIVDMVRNDLGRIALPGTVHVPALFTVEQYPTVWQMTSTVCATTHAPLDQILQSTFPPASITGAPKRRAMEIIAELEAAPRRVYTGAIGFVAPGRRAQFNVAIRTVLFDNANGDAEYGVGGGIVWDSQPVKEQQECVTKQKILHPRQRDFDLLETILWSPRCGYWLLDYHLQRLAQSAEYFGFRIDRQRIRAELDRIAADLPPCQHRVRLVVSRSGAYRCEPTQLESHAMRFADIPLAQIAVDTSDRFLYHKTTHRSIYENILKLSPGNEDVLLFNAAGEITESTRANVAFVIDGVFCTPPITCGLLPGTYRAWLLQRGVLRTEIITVAQALRATAAYLLNSVRGMQQVKIVLDGVVMPDAG